jgi:hypothetical protein
MSTDDGGEELATAEAAEHLRRLRDTLGPDQLREAFETGGGLMAHEENRLREALDVLGTQRTAEILDVEVPDSGLPGDQITIGGSRSAGGCPRSGPRPFPRTSERISSSGIDDGSDVFSIDMQLVVIVDPRVGLLVERDSGVELPSGVDLEPFDVRKICHAIGRLCVREATNDPGPSGWFLVGLAPVPPAPGLELILRDRHINQPTPNG